MDNNNGEQQQGQGQDQAQDVKQQRLAQLRAIPAWVAWENSSNSTNKLEDWAAQYAKLKAYCEEHNALPLKSNKDIGTWLNQQKQRFHPTRNQVENLSEKCQERLNQLREVAAWVGWENKVKERTNRGCNNWNERYERLKAYCDQHNALPPMSNKDIGQWCATQKRNFHHHQ